VVNRQVKSIQMIGALATPAALLVLGIEGLVSTLSIPKASLSNFDQYGLICSLAAVIIGLSILWWNLAILRKRQSIWKAEVVVMSAAGFGVLMCLFFAIVFILEIHYAVQTSAHHKNMTIFVSSAQLLVLLLWTVASCVPGVRTMKSQRLANQGGTTGA
jgi:hypothetical protein